MSHEQVLQDVEAMIQELKKERDVLNDLLVDLSDSASDHRLDRQEFADAGEERVKE